MGRRAEVRRQLRRADQADPSFEAGKDGWTSPARRPGTADSPGDRLGAGAERPVRRGLGRRTKDTVYTGFGLEKIQGADNQKALLRDTFEYLGAPSKPRFDAPAPLPDNNGGGNGNGNGGQPGGGKPPKKRSLAVKRRTLNVGKDRRFRVMFRCPPSKGTKCPGIIRATRDKKFQVADRRSASPRASTAR